VDTGIACGTGASAFDIFDQGTGNESSTRWFDQNGNLTKVETRIDYTFGEWSNPLTGAVVPYTQHNVETFNFAVPGDFSTVTTTQTGENIYTNPSTHKVVFLNAGRFVMAPDGSLVFQAGPDAFADFFGGDTSAIDGVCAALGA
jgi:hypothetical protein